MLGKASFRPMPQFSPEGATLNFEIIYDLADTRRLAAWREFLARAECPSHYVAPEYFLEPYWPGCKRFAVLALNDGRVAGVLTAIRDGSQVTSGLESRPQICVGDELPKGAVAEVLLRGLLAEAQAAELVTVYTWPDLELPCFSAYGFRARRLRGNVVLDLTAGADAVFKQFPKDRRRNIRFAEKNGVVVDEVTTGEDIVQAYEIYLAWWQSKQERLGGKPHSFEVFERAARLKENRLILVARVSGRPVAINFFRFFPGGLFESAANNSLDEFLYLKPNDLLQWRGIEWACAHGMRRHSLGGSHEFLLRFGGEVVPVLRYRMDRTLLHRHELPETARDYARRILKLMPAPIQERLRTLRSNGRSKRRTPPPVPQGK